MSYKIPYAEYVEQYSITFKKYASYVNVIGYMRLMVLLLTLYSLYYYIKHPESMVWCFSIIGIIIFLFLVTLHQRIKWKRDYYEQLIRINNEELEYVGSQTLFNDNGNKYVDSKHPYTFDLDIFGEASLFHHINRCRTVVGDRKLASFLNNADTPDIVKTQTLVLSLAEQLDWRQSFIALAGMYNDDEKQYKKVLAWTKLPTTKVHFFLRFLLIGLAIVFFSLLAMSIFWKSLAYFNLASMVFVFNLLVSGIWMNRIKEELSHGSQVATMMYKYSRLIDCIGENEIAAAHFNFKAGLPQKGQGPMALKKLASLFSSLDNALNLVGLLLFNGSCLWHVHVYFGLMEWREKYAAHIPHWLEAIGEVEAYLSLANFAYNNPEYTFPRINNSGVIIMKKAGHPLIPLVKRVGNDINFAEHRFIILTGSNMSGKSTFLRTLGVNMILAKIGAPICASEAYIDPLPILVSMRQTDSLMAGASYFFAEVKRIHDIIKALESRRHFILMDEILKGTNSDDKRSGTLGVIEKVVNLNAIGVIATHDIEVCLITERYPNVLANQCFEAIINNDSLVFDYQLRDGICRNKNATFLMRKMGIIE